LSERPYHIDLDSLRRAFPPQTEAPALLLDFAAGLADGPWGSVGCFDLVGAFAEQAPIVDGSPLRNQFALFMHLPEGSSVGAWCLPDRPVEAAPIVVLGSEGQHQIIAPSLAGLLAKIALQRFEEDGEWTDFTPHEDVDDATDELAEWLCERLGVDDLEPLAAMPKDLPDFAAWMGKWCHDRESYWAGHPRMKELASHLTAHEPAGQNPWARTSFEIAIVGTQYQVRVLDRGRKPIKEAAAIEPILRGLRDEMWQAERDLGLWFSMTMRLGADGSILPSFDYEMRPTFDDVPADVAQARADLARAPRPARWTPPWLAAS
jgi:hypothetical protein